MTLEASFTNGSLWGMAGDTSSPANAFGSQAAEVWAQGATGTMTTVVGVVDTGVNYTHIDLYLNIWLNQGEIPGAFKADLVDVDGDSLITFRDLNHTSNAAFVSDINGNGRIDAGDLLNDVRWENDIDEDGNGLKDDLVGWDFFNNDNDPMDDNGHGTHVAGTIGAMGGNGEGVAGVNWSVQMMALKFSGADGGGFVSRAASSIDYFTNASKANPDLNFVATNNSWSTGSYSTTLQGAVDRAAQAGILTVASAGNKSADTDVTANYPSTLSTVGAAGFEAVISVASINSGGGLSWFSSYGDVTVDIGAPGEGILSTTSNGSYGVMSGTSMAAPHVTGALALYASINPDATAAELRQVLLDAAAPTDSLAGKTVTGGRLDLGAMVEVVPPPPPPPPPPETGVLLIGTVGSDSLTGGAGADTLSGVPEGDKRLGHGTVDVLTGGAGDDLFVLGDARGTFYNDKKDANAGMNHYARIMDFQVGDRLQVSDDYATVFRQLTRDGFTGLGVYADTDGSGAWTKSDEMVGHLVGVVSLVAADLVFA